MNRYRQNRYVTLCVCFKNYANFLDEFIDVLDSDSLQSPNIISIEAGRFALIRADLKRWLRRTKGNPEHWRILVTGSVVGLKQISQRLVPLISAWMSTHRLEADYLSVARNLGSFFRLEQSWYRLCQIQPVVEGQNG